MPYSRTSELPAYVRKLPPVRQRQWMHVFNSCMSRGGDESRCFAMANGVAHKEIREWEPEGEVVTDELQLNIIQEAFPFSEESDNSESFPEANNVTSSYPTVGSASAGDTPVTVEDGEKLRRAQMDASSFAYIDPDGNRKLPIHTAGHVRNALARFNQTHFTSAAAKRTARRKILAAARRFGIEVSNSEKSVLSMLKEALGLGPDTIEYSGDVDTSVVTEESLWFTKQADGRIRWFGRYSNAWLDKDGEILTEEAHKDYMRWAYDTGTLPELWLWHTPGTRIGEADWLDFSDGFAHASGLVDEGKESVIDSLKSQDLGMSHGFLALQQGKWVRRYRSYELSILPRERAAVETSGFNILDAAKGAEVMPFTDERRKWLVDTLGEDAVAALEANTNKMATQLKDLGVEYKESEAQAANTDDAAASTEGIKTLATQVAELTSTVQQLVGVVGGVKSEVDGIKTAQKKTDDEKIEDAFLAKVAKAFGQNGGVTRPTESSNNVRTEGEKASQTQTDFFSQMIGEQLGTLQKAAADGGGVGTTAVGSVTVSSDGVQEVRD